MTNRENMIAVLEGEIPERIPLVVYGEIVYNNGPGFDGLIQQGLCIMPRVTVVNEIINDVEKIITKSKKDKYDIETIILRTKVGEITQVSMDGWIQEYFLKTPEDYLVMTFIIENTKLELLPDVFACWDKKVGEYGVPIIKANRSPLQAIIVDYAGLENYSYHMYDCYSELMELYKALENQLIEYCKLVALSPGRYVQLRENLTSEQMGPERYKKYHMPVYEKIISILHDVDKKYLLIMMVRFPAWLI